MDPLGFGLENYDAIGKWRTQDGKFPVDSSGAFPNGKTFNGPAEMKQLLKDNMPEFARCLAEKMLTYSLGRGVESYDRRTVQDSCGRPPRASISSRRLVQAIVHSAPFQQRRGRPVQGGDHQMIVTRKALSRRSMLKGLGAAISLPFLDAMTPAFAAPAAPRAAPPGVVLRAQRHRHAALDARAKKVRSARCPDCWRRSSPSRKTCSSSPISPRIGAVRCWSAPAITDAPPPPT